jgi:hypothetical protein
VRGDQDDWTNGPRGIVLPPRRPRADVARAEFEVQVREFQPDERPVRCAENVGRRLCKRAAKPGANRCAQHQAPGRER